VESRSYPSGISKPGLRDCAVLLPAVHFVDRDWATADAELALVLLVGAMVLANAFLYAGVAAGGFFVFNLMRKGSRRQA